MENAQTKCQIEATTEVDLLTQVTLGHFEHKIIDRVGGVGVIQNAKADRTNDSAHSSVDALLENLAFVLEYIDPKFKVGERIRQVAVDTGIKYLDESYVSFVVPGGIPQ